MGDEKLGINTGRKVFYRLIYKIFVVFAAILILSGNRIFAQELSITNNSDSLKFIKVAISDNSFKSLVYNKISIFSNSEYAVYEKATGKLITKFLPNDTAKINYSGGKFNIYVNNKIAAGNLQGTLIFDSQKGVLGVENLKRNGKQATYHGIFELTPKNDNQFYLINTLNLQSYLKGVVPNEMPTRFGLEALKAQAVAARNYVLMPRTKTCDKFDVDDSVASQVYFGAGTETSLSNQAVNETDGLVILYEWNLILAQYCSTAGGYTESYGNAFSDPKTKEFPSKEKPYLKGRPDIYNVAPLNREEEAKLFYMSCPDSYDMKSPYYRWKKEFDIKELTETLQRTLAEQSKTGFVKPAFNSGNTLGEIKELKVTKRGVSGKIVELEIVTDKQTYHAYKEIVIRRLLQKNGISLPSANAVFENLYDSNQKLTKITAYGGGFGHGVGMSQYGAGFMATSLHKPFDKILKRYYTGITISTVPLILSSSNTQKNISQRFYAPKKSAILVVDNKYGIKTINANINGREVSFELSNSLVPFNRMSRIDISSYVKQGENSIIFKFPDNQYGKAIRLYVELFPKDDSEYNF